jgi:hypothetical protein
VGAVGEAMCGRLARLLWSTARSRIGERRVRVGARVGGRGVGGVLWARRMCGSRPLYGAASRWGLVQVCCVSGTGGGSMDDGRGRMGRAEDRKPNADLPRWWGAGGLHANAQAPKLPSSKLKLQASSSSFKLKLFGN